MKMKRIVLVAVLLVFQLALAQGLYVGGGATLSSPGLGAQLGVALPGGLELRAVVFTAGNLSPTTAGVDFLYNVTLPASRIYLGVGGDAFFASAATNKETEATGRTLGLHATGGAELRLGSLGMFGEVQPVLRLEPLEGYLRTRVGLNLHF